MRRTLRHLLITAALAAAVSPLAAAPAAGVGCTDPKCRIDRWVFTAALRDFLAARSGPAPDAYFDWSSDGCSGPTGGQNDQFVHACYRHDFGYRNYKRHRLLTEDHRGQIDIQFRKDMYQICGTGRPCRDKADLYYRAVRLCGGSVKPPVCPKSHVHAAPPGARPA